MRVASFGSELLQRVGEAYDEAVLWGSGWNGGRRQMGRKVGSFSWSRFVGLGRFLLGVRREGNEDSGTGHVSEFCVSLSEIDCTRVNLCNVSIRLQHVT